MEVAYHQPIAQPRKIRTITLKKGKSMQDIEQVKYNKVNTTLYFQQSFTRSFLLFFFDTLVSYENGIGLVALIIQMIFRADSDLFFLFTTITLTINIIGFIIINLLNDRSRNIGDTRVNSQTTRKFSHQSGTFEDCQWKNLLAGDIIKVQENEEFPADCLILDSSEVEHHCLLDTSSLDEDQVIRARYSCEDTRNISGKAIEPADYVKQIDGTLKYEPPNSRFYEFEGVLKLTTFPASKHITIDNIALRGYKLKNSSMYGLVLNIGNENKCLFCKIGKSLNHCSFRP